MNFAGWLGIGARMRGKGVAFIPKRPNRYLVKLHTVKEVSRSLRLSVISVWDNFLKLKNIKCRSHYFAANQSNCRLIGYSFCYQQTESAEIVTPRSRYARCRKDWKNLGKNDFKAKRTKRAQYQYEDEVFLWKMIVVERNSVGYYSTGRTNTTVDFCWLSSLYPTYEPTIGADCWKWKCGQQCDL